VHILVATDADYVVNDVTGALSSPDTRFTIVSEGREVSRLVARGGIDLAILDLQIGSKGGMAVTMDLRLDESAERVPHVKVLMLLDRKADVHLAKRSAADGWITKPFDPLALKRAVKLVLEGPAIEVTVDATGDDQVDGAATDSAEEEPATAG
jgi:two-component system nitrate/nitrite response regulator NarL